jgi:DNA-binding XRE family transcriptional regulator
MLCRRITQTRGLRLSGRYQLLLVWGIIMHIGIVLRDIRREQNMTKRQLAELSGLHRNTLRRMESGKYTSGVDKIERVAHALGYELELMKRE